MSTQEETIEALRISRSLLELEVQRLRAEIARILAQRDRAVDRMRLMLDKRKQAGLNEFGLSELITEVEGRLDRVQFYNEKLDSIPFLEQLIKDLKIIEENI